MELSNYGDPRQHRRRTFCSSSTHQCVHCLACVCGLSLDFPHAQPISRCTRKHAPCRQSPRLSRCCVVCRADWPGWRPTAHGSASFDRQLEPEAAPARPQGVLVRRRALGSDSQHARSAIFATFVCRSTTPPCARLRFVLTASRGSPDLALPASVAAALAQCRPWRLISVLILRRSR